MPLALPIDREALAAFCRRNHVAKLELFGSRAKGIRANRIYDCTPSLPLPSGSPSPAFAALLDFRSLASVQRYAAVSIQRLKAVYARSHPVEQDGETPLQRRQRPGRIHPR